jgi:hypothetical protein
MKPRPIAAILLVTVGAFASGCAGTFGGTGQSVSRSIKITEGSRIASQNIVPENPKYRRVAEHLALAQEIYGAKADALQARRDQLRSRRRTLTLASYITFAATTLLVSAAAIEASGDETMSEDGTLRMSGYGALGGLGVGTTMQVLNFMQEDPANVEAKIASLDGAYDTMIDRLRVIFEQAETQGAEGRSIELQTGPIIESFIADALKIHIKG